MSERQSASKVFPPRKASIRGFSAKVNTEMSRNLARIVTKQLGAIAVLLVVSPFMASGQAKPLRTGLVQIARPAGSEPFDVTTSIKAALQNLGKAGGTIEFTTTGIYNVTSTISLDGIQALRIRCAVGDSHAAADHQVIDLIYTQKTGSLFAARGVRSLEIDHCNLAYSNSNYTGRLIDLSGGSPQGDTTEVYLHDNRLGGLSTTDNRAAALIYLQSSDHITIERNFLTGAQTGILGPSNAIIAANMIMIRGNYFTGPFGDVAIRAGGTTWSISGNVFEPRSKDICGAFDTTSVGVSALSFQSNWIGDGHYGTCVAASKGPILGAEITGNEIEGALVGISLGISDGVSITGNHFEVVKLAVDASSATNVNIVANSFSKSVAIPNLVRMPVAN